MAWERKIGKRWVTVGTHKWGIHLGFNISRYSFDLDLLFIYLSIEF